MKSVSKQVRREVQDQVFRSLSNYLYHLYHHVHWEVQDPLFQQVRRQVDLQARGITEDQLNEIG